MPFAFRLEASSGRARAGTIVTDHGDVPTPVFMPVGTQGAVKGTTVETVWDTGARILLGNAYHLYLRPGVDLIERAGGLHRFMGWRGAVLTDSGGYQVFSLASLQRVTRSGVEFRSHIDGSLHEFTPEAVMDAQARIGADILMSFDTFAGIPCTRADAEQAVELTTEWARRGRAVHGARFNRCGYEQVVFGIVQGGEYPDLRARSLAEIAALDFPGYAIGGLSRRRQEETRISWSNRGLLDRARATSWGWDSARSRRRLARGVDMYDCVLPKMAHWRHVHRRRWCLRCAHAGPAPSTGVRVSVPTTRRVPRHLFWPADTGRACDAAQPVFTRTMRAAPRSSRHVQAWRARSWKSERGVGEPASRKTKGGPLESVHRNHHVCHDARRPERRRAQPVLHAAPDPGDAGDLLLPAHPATADARRRCRDVATVKGDRVVT
jgi:queuine tRNA-ribosyltransferase